MPTANEIYRDSAIRNQIELRRYLSGVVKKTTNLLEQADQDLVAKLRSRLGFFTKDSVSQKNKRWKALLKDIRQARKDVLKEYKRLARAELSTLSVVEAAREVGALESAIPIGVALATVVPARLRSIATSEPFQGKFLRDWFNQLEVRDREALKQAIQLGLVEGESVDEIVKRVIGTRAKKYTDGVLSISRREAQGIVRLAVSHVSNGARNAVWEENKDVISATIWVAVLDGRTTAICRSRDGKGSPVGGGRLPPGISPLVPPNATIPAHWNCRSFKVAYIDGIGLIGNRPYVSDIRTPKKRNIDFRKMAKEQGTSVAAIREKWANENIGRVPASTTYQEFLERQSAKFQDEVLGKKRGILFRKGGLTVDEFVDRQGNTLTLRELAERKPEAFEAAGIVLKN